MVNTINVQDIVHFHAAQQLKLPCGFEGVVGGFTHAFEFGAAYLLDGWPWDGGDTLSWIVGGVIEPEFGKITHNGQPFLQKNRLAVAWCVRYSKIKTHRFQLHSPTVQDQIQFGLRTVKDQIFTTETEIISHFQLTPERYRRPIHQLSNEAWRASCAIGLANGRRIFCFPYMRPNLLSEYLISWFNSVIELLKNANAMILLPTTALGIDSTLLHNFDEIVGMKSLNDSLQK